MRKPLRYALIHCNTISDTVIDSVLRSKIVEMATEIGPHSSIWYSEKTRVVNLHQGFPEGGIYIGRAGKGHEGYFGNPITIPEPSSREDVLNKYRAYIEKRLEIDPIFRARVKLLSGKTLVCFCIPKLCHGMILAEVADRL